MNPTEIYTEESIQLTKIYLQARALLETIYPVVTKYQNEILIELDAKDRKTGKPVRNDTFIFLVDKETYSQYILRCKEQASKNGLKYNKKCPLEEAKELYYCAKNELGTHLLKITPGFQHLTLAKMAVFDKKNGEIYENEFGRFVSRLDRFIEICLPVLVPLTQKK